MSGPDLLARIASAQQSLRLARVCIEHGEPANGLEDLDAADEDLTAVAHALAAVAPPDPLAAATADAARTGAS